MNFDSIFWRLSGNLNWPGCLKACLLFGGSGIKMGEDVKSQNFKTPLVEVDINCKETPSSGFMTSYFPEVGEI